MTDVTTAQELFTQFAGKTIDAIALWVEANQRVMRELVELGSMTAKESVRLCGDLQRAGLESLREGQAWAQRCQGDWKDASDPAAWYQKLMADGISGTQQAFRLADDRAPPHSHVDAAVRAGHPPLLPGVPAAVPDARVGTLPEAVDWILKNAAGLS